MAKAQTETGATLDVSDISLNFNITYKDKSGDDVPGKSFGDSAFINLNDESALNKIVKEKPWILDIIPGLISSLKVNYDPDNAQAAELKARVKQALSA